MKGLRNMGKEILTTTEEAWKIFAKGRENSSDD